MCSLSSKISFENSYFSKNFHHNAFDNFKKRQKCEAKVQIYLGLKIVFVNNITLIYVNNLKMPNIQDRDKTPPIFESKSSNLICGSSLTISNLF